MRAGLGEDPGDRRPLLRAHTYIESTINNTKEILRPAPVERFPCLRGEGVILELAPACARLLAAVTSEGYVIGGIGEGHMGFRPSKEAFHVVSFRGVPRPRGGEAMIKVLEQLLLCQATEELLVECTRPVGRE